VSVHSGANGFAKCRCLMRCRSSGTQILPKIKDKCKEFVNFIREATWVAPPLGAEFKKYTDEEQEHFLSDPDFYLEMRRQTEKSMNTNFEIFHAGSSEQQMIRQYMLGLTETKLKSEYLEKVLIPKWAHTPRLVILNRSLTKRHLVCCLPKNHVRYEVS